MIGLADENGRTYKSDYGTYNRDDGFVFLPQFSRNCSIPISLVNKLFHEDLWKLKEDPVKEMSLADIEKELGYRVRIIDPEPNKKKVSEERKKEVDDTIDVFKRLFGIDLDPEEYY